MADDLQRRCRLAASLDRQLESALSVALLRQRRARNRSADLDEGGDRGRTAPRQECAHYFDGQKNGAAATGTTDLPPAPAKTGLWPQVKRWLRSTFV
jgi:hypothetical protein